MKNKILQSFMISFLLLLITTSFAFEKAQKAEKKTTELAINSWLLLGPFPSPLPGLYKQNKKGSAVEDLLKFKEVNLPCSGPKPEAPSDGMTAIWLIGRK